MRFIVRLIITLIALYAAVWIVNGIEVVGTSAWLAYTIMAVVLSLVNLFVKPILKFLSCGLIVATLGLFLLVINTFVLWLASWICQQFGIGFLVNGLWPAFLGSLVISAVSFVLSIFVPDKEK
jgi:putative membrane protein